MSSLDTALCEVLLRLDPRHRRFGSCVLRTPIESIASGFWLEGSSDKSCRYVWCSVMPLFKPPPFDVTFNFGTRLLGSTCWTPADAERLLATAAPACAALGAGDSLTAFIEMIRRDPLGDQNPYFGQAHALALTKLGRIAEAIPVFEKLEASLDPSGWEGRMKLWARQAIADAPTGRLDEQMLEWEDGARKAHQLPPRQST
jgi:hypothetical protein